jgi:uncharacterized membrane protein YoaK (UPF0700 family)
MVLAAVGGLLDAFVYLNHGKVFAGAMTGNAVLCGIAVISHNSSRLLHNAMPIFGFLCGLWAAERVEGWLRHHAATVALGAEATGLLIASFLPGSFPDAAFVFAVSLLTAFQIASFRKVDQYSYNSTFITSDLRTIVIGLYEALDPQNRSKGLRQAREIGLVVLAFIAGAVVAAGTAPRLGNHTLWLACIGLIAVLANALRRSVAGEAKRRHAGH